MAPTVKLMTNKTHGPRIEQTAQGNRAVLHYLVSNSIPDVAINAAGVPEIGDAYGTSLPGAYVQRKRPIQMGGGVLATAPGYNADLNGWCYVEVTYGPPESTGVTPDLSSWTEVIQSARGERVYFPIDPATGLAEEGAPELAGGEGTTIMNGQTEVAVHTFHTGTVPTALKAYILNTLTRPCKVNDAGIVLPRYGAPGNLDSLTLGPGQALYLSHTMRQSSPGVIQLTHHLAISKDFLFFDAFRDTEGYSVNAGPKTVYGQASFTGLW